MIEVMKFCVMIKMSIRLFMNEDVDWCSISFYFAIKLSISMKRISPIVFAFA